jgi:hypothetical protein
VGKKLVFNKLTVQQRQTYHGICDRFYSAEWFHKSEKKARPTFSNPVGESYSLTEILDTFQYTFFGNGKIKEDIKQAAEAINDMNEYLQELQNNYKCNEIDTSTFPKWSDLFKP